MQASWRKDSDKLTFIICQPLPAKDKLVKDDKNEETVLKEPHYDVGDCMLGDVNMFLSVEEVQNEDEDAQNEKQPQPSLRRRRVIGELELMIAETRHQRRGFGRAGLLCFLKYIADHERDIVRAFLGPMGAVEAGVSEPTKHRDAMGKSDDSEEKLSKIESLVVKIGESNSRSLALFEGLLFAKLSQEANVFGELELRKAGLRPDETERLMDRYDVRDYHEIYYGL